MVKHEEFLNLVNNRVVKTYSDRGGVAIGNNDYVTLIGSKFEGVTFIGCLARKDYAEFLSLINQIGLEYCTRIYVNSDDVYIFEQDSQPFKKTQRLNRGNSIVFTGRGSLRKNYMLLVRDF